MHVPKHRRERRQGVVGPDPRRPRRQSAPDDRPRGRDGVLRRPDARALDGRGRLGARAQRGPDRRRDGRQGRERVRRGREHADGPGAGRQGDRAVRPRAARAAARRRRASIGLLVAWWLSSHLFMSTAHALDHAYHVEHGRTTVVQRFIALAFALVSVGIVAASVELMVTGPLGNPEGGLARRLGLSEEYALALVAAALAAAAAMVVAFLGLPLPLQPERQALPAATACRARCSARRCGSSPRPRSG